MNLKKCLLTFLPVLVLASVLSLAMLESGNAALQPAAISPDIPVGTEIPGWIGQKTQESERERQLLAKDTIFSKGLYRRLNMPTFGNKPEAHGPTVSVSIVYSGQDLNNSIHRPERCLPSQGHQGLRIRDVVLQVTPPGADKPREITCKEIKSFTLTANTEEASLKHVHYYFFIGNDRLCHSHWSRTFLDIWDRMVKGKTQSWAYLQVGSYWGGGTGVDEQTAEKAAQEIISEIAGRQIIWDKIKN